jgi:hypothetical protein
MIQTFNSISHHTVGDVEELGFMSNRTFDFVQPCAAEDVNELGFMGNCTFDFVQPYATNDVNELGYGFHGCWKLVRTAVASQPTASVPFF